MVRCPNIISKVKLKEANFVGFNWRESKKTKMFCCRSSHKSMYVINQGTLGYSTASPTKRPSDENESIPGSYVNGNVTFNKDNIKEDKKQNVPPVQEEQKEEENSKRVGIRAPAVNIEDNKEIQKYPKSKE